VPGFVEFHLLKGPEHEDFTLYASHTVWQNQGAFEAWTKSEAFRAAHKDAGQNKALYIDHPQFEGFEVRQTVGRGTTAVAEGFAGGIVVVCSVLKDQARRRAVSENTAILVGQLSLGRTDTAPTGNDLAFGLDQAGLRGDRPKQRDLELERRLRKALVQH